MIEDLDSLQSFIHRYYTSLALLEERTGIFVDSEFEKLKKRFLEINPSTANFVETVRQGLDILNDGHTGLVAKEQIKWSATNKHNYLSEAESITLNDTLSPDIYRNTILENIFANLKINLMIKYLNGKYYNVLPTEFEGDTIHSGEEVTAINTIPIHDFVRENRTQMVYVYWDNVHKRWYTRTLVLYIAMTGQQKFTLTIDGKDYRLQTDKATKLLRNRHPGSLSPKVFLIDDNILYVQMPMMMNKDWYRTEFLNKYHSGVEKIVLDIRDNGGGDDSVWQGLLSKIINSPLKYRYKVLIPNEEPLKAALQPFGNITVQDDCAIIDTTRIITPGSNSVYFDGKIYILQNPFTFSAAAALSSVAKQNENLVLVGEPSAGIVGYAFPSIMLKLPNSGIVFKLTFSTDLTGGTADPFMDKVEVPIFEDNIDDYLNKTLNYDAYGEEFLSQKDKLIKFVREKN